MIVRRGVTRVVFVGKRYAVKVPRIPWGAEGWRITHGPFGWILRGWLANRSEWRQRARGDVARPLCTIAHVALVVPSAEVLLEEDLPGELALMLNAYRGDEAKSSSWGRLGNRWVLIDFDRAWEQGDRGIVGGLYYGWQERRARKWARL